MERKLVLTIATLALLAIASQILVWVFAEHVPEADFSGPLRSGYTLRDFTLDALDADGQHAFSIVAPRLARKDEDGSIFVTNPDYAIIDGSGNVWKGTSDSAWVNKAGTVMKLEGKVAMHRLPTATVAPAQLLTSDLTVTTSPKVKDATPPQTREKIMQTAALTTITMPGQVVHGVGMHADLGLKTVQLLSDVHAILLPSQHRDMHE